MAGRAPARRLHYPHTGASPCLSDRCLWPVGGAAAWAWLGPGTAILVGVVTAPSISFPLAGVGPALCLSFAWLCDFRLSHELLLASLACEEHPAGSPTGWPCCGGEAARGGLRDPPSSELPWAGPLETGVGLLSRVLEAGKWPLWQDEASGLGPAPPPPWAYGQAGTCLGAPGAPELHRAAAAMLGPRPGFWKQDWTFCLWKVGQRVHCCALGDGAPANSPT